MQTLVQCVADALQDVHCSHDHAANVIRCKHHLPSHKYVQELTSILPDRSQHTLPAAAHFAQWHLWMAACLTLSMQRATWQILHPACVLSIGMSVSHAASKVYCVVCTHPAQNNQDGSTGLLNSKNCLLFREQIWIALHDKMHKAMYTSLQGRTTITEWCEQEYL